MFTDNAGVIRFNERLCLAYKVETHNSPSALDPYGGAMTGIVGVNRDPFGTGLGARLIANVWGYCLGDPFYKGELPRGLLHPARIRDGVHRGVIDGGNQSGIPYARGWELFDERFMGKPLVFCGTVGELPPTIGGTDAVAKQVLPGDAVVMVGGRMGKDGIHGATFSSEELHAGSPVQAVQIGDPITQKKMSDMLLEARDRAPVPRHHRQRGGRPELLGRRDGPALRGLRHRPGPGAAQVRRAWPPGRSWSPRPRSA